MMRQWRRKRNKRMEKTKMKGNTYTAVKNLDALHILIKTLNGKLADRKGEISRSIMAMLVKGAVAALGGAFVYANLPTRLTIGAIAPTAAYLSEAKLIPISDESRFDEGNILQASSLFSKGPTMVMAVRRPGCMLCRKEAAELSTLEPNMKAAGINLIAVVHETKGVNDFKPYFKGEVYFDKERHFYGPNQRWLPLWMGFLRVGSYVNIYKARQAGYHGNTDGEGRLLGGEL
ncbi:hypothetical protein NECAME_13174 [Necator americanus]|uniref:Peroxiredoxin-like 2A n=1 Tax=Necator americanus TaxID=51031 RepID=W2SWY9_NECAM|nr:hypothetical protein NECAME_13174 [Necator americanus]ETN74155.1 hypothetical protein NECAME_13174 [Necator americanus]